jgi:hypothetical protein
MDIHKNARLTLRRREDLIQYVDRGVTLKLAAGSQAPSGCWPGQTPALCGVNSRFLTRPSAAFGMTGVFICDDAFPVVEVCGAPEGAPLSKHIFNLQT